MKKFISTNQMLAFMTNRLISDVHSSRFAGFKSPGKLISKVIDW